jgi:hypothetical protein
MAIGSQTSKKELLRSGLGKAITYGKLFVDDTEMKDVDDAITFLSSKHTEDSQVWRDKLSLDYQLPTESAATAADITSVLGSLSSTAEGAFCALYHLCL